MSLGDWTVEDAPRDCKHGRLARSCETCEWESRAIKAEALAREAGEALEGVLMAEPVRRISPERAQKWADLRAILTKLRAAGILKGGE